MKEDKSRDYKKKKLIRKRILQCAFLALMLGALAASIYVAIAATRLMRLRAERAANRPQQTEAAAAVTDAPVSTAADVTAAPEVSVSAAESTDAEREVPTSEAIATAADDSFNFLDLFNPDLFRDPVDDSSDFEALAAQYAGEKRIWMGDSRFVGITNTVALQPTDVFISKGAMAFDWFSTEGIMQLQAELAADPYRIVIINFGLNDCANNIVGWHDYFVNNYVDLINQLIDTYPETKFYFASVGTVDGEYTASFGRKLARDEVNLYVDQFNAAMYAQCRANYIDLSEYLVRTGFATVDGVHFDANTNLKIYRYCVAKAGAYR